MSITLDLLTESHGEPCGRCGSTDASGGVLLQDNTGAQAVFCRGCTQELVAAILTPSPIALAS